MDAVRVMNLNKWQKSTFVSETWCVNNIPLNPIMHFCYNIILCLCRKGRGTGRGGWSHPQGDMHMVAARLGCKRAMVGTGWATSHPDCMDRLRKHYSHLVGGSFLARKAAWVLSGYMTTECALLHAH